MSSSNLTRIGKYEITGILGRGGMGRVYQAFDRQLSRDVAIKTLTEGFVGDSEMLERFYREAAKTGMLKHPNIVTVYDLGEQDGFPYIVMEYVAGEALDRVIRSKRPLTLSTKLTIVEQVCHALAYAHRNDVIHRDVKPANVILQPDGFVKLLDFGIARQEKRDETLTRSGSVIGTVHYMAPERLQNRSFDGRSDIFSTGVMLYQLLSGQLPFEGEEYAIIQKILSEPYPPLASHLSNYPPELDEILSRSLAKQPEDRYVTADEMASEISNVAEQLKREQVVEMFQQAERLVGNEEYTKAREVLLRVAKLDAKHVGARQLMVIVQQTLARRERAAQIQQLRSQAEDARLEKRFADAVALLEQALKLDPTNSELAEAVESVRQKKRRYEQIEGLLRRAEAAREKEDFAGAQAEVAKALELDKDDSRVRAIQTVLLRQMEEAARTAKTKKLLDTARSEVGARHFTAAIKLLTEVEQLDPANPELIPLLQAAKSGQEQEQRRRVVERLANEIAIAVTPDEVSRALAMVNEALARMPNEPALLKFKGQLERQTDEYDTRRTVDETVQKCRSLLEKSPGEALRLVQEKLRMLPGNERLQVLCASVEEHLRRQTAEESRVRYLTLANEALNKRQYREAVRLLESCQAEGAFSDEMRGLLEFARHEATREQRVSIIEANMSQAQALMSKAAHEDAIRLLEATVAQTGDLGAKHLLEKARAQQQDLQRKADAISVEMAKYIREEQFDEGVAFLKSQPQDVLQQPAAKEALKTLRAMRDRSHQELRAIGQAYAALDTQDFAVGRNALETSLRAHADYPLLSRIQQSVESRRLGLADRKVTEMINRVQAAISAGDERSAQEALDAAATLAESASLEVQSKWQRLNKELVRSNIISRVGLKRPPAM